MPAASDAVTSDGEGDKIHAGSTNKKYSAKKNRRESAGAEEQVEEQANDEEEGDEEEEEEEFEIEAIIEAKRGTFANGRYGYLVKWKNYGPEHNSWVDEQDAGNAEDLIEEYWRKHKKDKKAPRKSIEKTRRKSSVRDDSAETGSASKKRARSQKSAKEANGTTKKAKKETVTGEDADDMVLGNMGKYMQAPNWEHLIETVDTIERDDESNELYVYFTLKKGGERIRETSKLCGERFPQKLLRFYESNLRWKAGDDRNQ
ncbi:hypothetical protein SERLA73DRAFT_77108 [Serpula lacrymans var. lacrymans S7.3]|uniref:Chromo domain-containing protein n=1 Tax=Serpula lacrymans var. lacrymans (strain S7.3) TaxID=936435 RepID=F8Q942_SERL3|nr:hypothetical protein SERLA73DRAFT_77108 [Serpula lacrymans var. lacrymans S7.3]